VMQINGADHLESQFMPETSWKNTYRLGILWQEIIRFLEKNVTP